jgi:hypothetical protein
MSHLNDDELLLFAYGDADQHQAHLASCAECRARLATLEESRAAIDMGLERRAPGRGRRWAWIALPLAAGIGALLLRPEPAAEPQWHSTFSSSAAGYVSSNELMTLDSQLTRLERGTTYGTLIQD